MRGAHTPNYVSALRGNGVMYESERLFGRRKRERLMFSGCKEWFSTFSQNLEGSSSSGGIIFPLQLPLVVFTDCKAECDHNSSLHSHVCVPFILLPWTNWQGKSEGQRRRARPREKGEAPIRTIISTRSFLVHRNSLPCCQRKLKRIMWGK